MKKIKIIITLFVLALCAGVFSQKDSVLASDEAERIELKEGKTYSQYDITGDGKKDDLIVSRYKDEWDDGIYNQYDDYDGVRVYLNGERVYQKETGDVWILSNLYVLKNGTIYLEIRAYGESDILEVGKLLQYKSGKMVAVLDLVRKQGSGSIEKIENDSITVSYGECYLTLGLAYFKYTYTYKEGKWQESKYGKILKVVTRPEEYVWTSTKKLKVKISFTAYKAVNSNKKAVKVKAGDTVKILKCYVYKNNVYFQISCDGKKGWIKDGCNESLDWTPLFENLAFGG